MILVTGGSGFVGSHLVEKLRAGGEAVRCLVRATSSTRYFPGGVETAVADLATGRGIEPALDGVDTVFHLAGVTRALSTAAYYAANATATGKLVEALQGRSIRFVHVSSLSAVGPSLDGRPVDEDTIPHPMSSYGKSKLEGERIARALAPQARIVRPPVVYGPRDTSVFQILKSVAQGRVLEIAGGERWFSAIYVEDLVEGLMATARAGMAAGRTYFMAYRQPATWRELEATAAKIMGRKPRILRVPVGAAQSVGFLFEMWSRITRNPAMISREKVAEACCRFWICDSARAASELGFEASTPLSTGLAKTLAWYKEAGWLKY